MVNTKFLSYYDIMSKEGKNRVKLKMQEEELLLQIKNIANQELSDKIQNEFNSIYHSYDFKYYLEILERCKKLLLKDIDDFDAIKKIIYQNTDLLL